MRQTVIAIFGFLPQLCFAQVKIGNNPSSMSSSALVEMESTERGLLVPRMKTSERNSIAWPAQGLMVYDTEVNGFFVYNGAVWAPLDYSLPSGSLVLGNSANDGNLLNNNFSFVGKMFSELQLTNVITASGNSWLKMSDGFQERSQMTTLRAGSQVIFWGGYNQSTGFNDGTFYNPVNDSWTAIPPIGDGINRYGISIAWTGSNLIIWGGYYENALGGITPLSNGFIFNPATNSWTEMNNLNAPSARYNTACGYNPATNEFIVWGGFAGVTYMSNGAKYNLNTNTWTPISNTSSPSARFSPGYSVANGKLFIHGGVGPGFTYLGDTYLYDIASNSWTPGAVCPLTPRYFIYEADWTGSQFIVWGGFNDSGNPNDGARYNPVTNSWTSITTVGGPSTGGYRIPTYANNKLFVFGGELKSFDLTSNTWSNLPAGISQPYRIFSAVEATSDCVIMYGGNTDATPGQESIRSGYRYFPNTTLNITSTYSTPQFLYLYRKN